MLSPVYTSIKIGASVISNAAFGPGNGPVLLDNVWCTGLEYTLFDCPHGGLDTQSCPHSRDAGVVCNEGKFLIIFYLP